MKTHQIRLFLILTAAFSLCYASGMTLIGRHFSTDRSHFISLGPHFHIGFRSRDWITDVAFFNQQEGPYTGSIIQLDGYPPIHKTVGFGRTAGIYYRYFLFDAGPLWTLLVNIGYIAVPLGALSAWIARKLLVKCKNIS